jgi:catechol 2,3-dioxygenase-like lactoylglutathione lyase family enzyme
MGLRYFGVRVRELERSVAFYTGLFGLREQRRGRMAHGGIWVLLADPRTRQRLELNWYPPGSPFATRYLPGDGLDHLGFRVPDAAKVARSLAKAGVRPALLPSDRNGMRGIYYFLDPDGNWIELF